MTEVLIRNHCAFERIDVQFLPPVETALVGMLRCCGDRVPEIRLQGSIARGDARVDHADLDMIALVDGTPTEQEVRCLEELGASLDAASHVVSRFDLEIVDANALEPFRRFVLSSDSLCIHGTDSLTLPGQAMERRALAQLVTPHPSEMLPDYLTWVEELASAEDGERRFASRIIGKDLLKVLRGVLLLRCAPYEVAIPRIAAQVPLFAPEAAEAAALLFALYAEPTPDLEEIRDAANLAVKLLESCPEIALLRGAANANPAIAGQTDA